MISGDVNSRIWVASSSNSGQTVCKNDRCLEFALYHVSCPVLDCHAMQPAAALSTVYLIVSISFSWTEYPARGS